MNALAAELRGPVRRRGHTGFRESLLGHSLALRHDPQVVVEAADERDVAVTVRHARRHGWQLHVHATGHGPSTLARDGIVLRTGALDRIAVDPQHRTARVGAGVTWGSLAEACAAHGLAARGMASVASVGVVGYLLGGGAGPLGRAEGFGADHVLGLDVVDASGRTLRVDAEREPELFWALRGGRVAPCVVTSVELRLTTARELLAGTATVDAAEMPSALAAYADWQRDLGDVTSSIATMFAFPDTPELPVRLRGRRYLRLDVIDAGGEVDGAGAWTRLLRAMPSASATSGSTDPAGWLRAQDPVPASRSWQRGALLDVFDTGSAADLLEVAGPESGAPWRVVEIRPFGGALARPPERDNAVGGRTDGVLLNVIAPAPADAAAAAGIDSAYADLRTAVPIRSGVNANFHGPDAPGHAVRDAWPDTVRARLDAVHARYDPDGVFPVLPTGR